jgi:nicotinamidase-related amidase
MLIKRDDCCLLVIDVQERLLPAMYDPEGVTGRCRDLLSAAQAFGIPILVTEHYPRGIGATAAALRDFVAPGSVVQKIHFSGFTEPQVRQRIRAVEKDTLVLAGMEAHVCLGQTALDLVVAGYRVIVSSDATASRTRLDHETALHRLAGAGASIRTTQAIIDAWRAQDVVADADRVRTGLGRAT